MYVTVNMLDVLENYKKSVNFYNTYDDHKKKTQIQSKTDNTNTQSKNPENKKWFFMFFDIN